MKITPEMLDVEAKKTTIWQTALGSMNVDECLCAYLNALLESGKAIMAEGVVCEGDISPIFQKGIFIRLDNADERKRKQKPAAIADDGQKV